MFYSFFGGLKIQVRSVEKKTERIREQSGFSLEKKKFARKMEFIYDNNNRIFVHVRVHMRVIIIFLLLCCCCCCCSFVIDRNQNLTNDEKKRHICGAVCKR